MRADDASRPGLANDIAGYLNRQYENELERLTEPVVAQISVGVWPNAAYTPGPKAELMSALNLFNGFLAGRGQGSVALVVRGGKGGNRFAAREDG